MAISLKRTGSIVGATKILVHGTSGAGKTKLIGTLPRPVVISAERGLASLRDEDVFAIEVATLADVHEAYSWLTSSDEARDFDSVAIDSISEVAEVVLAAEKRVAKDPRQAYGAMQDQMSELIRAFRDVPRHVYMIAKTEKATDEMGRILYSPSMPGNKAGQALPYFFDEVFALRAEKDSEGVTQRMLMTDTDGLWTAKDRSGRLSSWESPDLGAIITKIEAKKETT
jgi:hypothetical protein